MIPLLPLLAEKILAPFIIKKIGESFVEKPFYQSKKFWVTVLAAVVPILNKALGWELNVEEVSTVMAPFLAYVVGQGLADFGKNQK